MAIICSAFSGNEGNPRKLSLDDVGTMSLNESNLSGKKCAWSEFICETVEDEKNEAPLSDFSPRISPIPPGFEIIFVSARFSTCEVFKCFPNVRKTVWEQLTGI